MASVWSLLFVLLGAIIVVIFSVDGNPISNLDPEPISALNRISNFGLKMRERRAAKEGKPPPKDKPKKGDEKKKDKKKKDKKEDEKKKKEEPKKKKDKKKGEKAEGKSKE
ncbi:UNVERIFIED_CONTAM: hypothetical protein RMT77_015937 [Armadillidium vulgare]